MNAENLDDEAVSDTVHHKASVAWAIIERISQGDVSEEALEDAAALLMGAEHGELSDLLARMRASEG